MTGQFLKIVQYFLTFLQRYEPNSWCLWTEETILPLHRQRSLIWDNACWPPYPIYVYKVSNSDKLCFFIKLFLVLKVVNLSGRCLHYAKCWYLELGHGCWDQYTEKFTEVSFLCWFLFLNFGILSWIVLYKVLLWGREITPNWMQIFLISRKHIYVYCTCRRVFAH